MPAKFPYKLLAYETQPPPTSWEKLGQWLNTEYHHADGSLELKLSDAEINPPHISWEIIKAGIGDKKTEGIMPEPARQKTKVIPFFYKRLAIAAVVTGIAAIAALYLFYAPQEKQSPALADTEESASLRTIDPEKNPDFDAQVSPDPSYPADASASASSPGKNRLAIAANILPVKTTREPAAGNIPQQNNNNITPVNIPEIQAVNALQPVSVKAPPIRDEGGNIILDVNLISSPNSPHIVVTSPNGSQTRISNKFLHCLSYLNGLPAETNTEGKEWEARFQEWRNQLLQEPAFIPAANNFFDIFELKEMILER